KSWESWASDRGSPAVSNAASRMPLILLNSSVIAQSRSDSDISPLPSGGGRGRELRPTRCTHLSALGFQRERRIALALHVYRRVRLRLRDVQQLLARELQYGKERHHQSRDVHAGLEQGREFEEPPGLEQLEQPDHLATDRQLLP